MAHNNCRSATVTGAGLLHFEDCDQENTKNSRRHLLVTGRDPAQDRGGVRSQSRRRDVVPLGDPLPGVSQL